MVEPRPPVDLIGLHGGEWFGAAAGAALAGADVVVGSPRHLAAVAASLPATAQRRPLGDLGAALGRIASEREAGVRVAVLASGDPGFFGLGRLARARLGPAPGVVRVHPAPSSVALACARAGVHWDDATVVSAHGRAPDTAVEAVRREAKVAVLCSPATPPEELGRLLVAAGTPPRDVFVASRLGEPDERSWAGDLRELATGAFDPLSVAVFETPGPGRTGGPGMVWGRPESAFLHRDGMITKAEVRAVALGKLELVPAGVMWDIGAGSGSVSSECARLAAGLAIYAVERRLGDIPALQANLQGTGTTVVVGEAPPALDGLPDPDRVFVGGGGTEVLDAALGRLRPGGRVVATYAVLARALEAADRLGEMIQVSVSRAVPTGAGGPLRLAAENPVFVCWGGRP
jgi:precorrin-6Y C5,15-methyltransferase (decarboxylating)